MKPRHVENGSEVTNLKQGRIGVVRLAQGFPSAEKIKYGLGPGLFYITKEQSKYADIHVITNGKPGCETTHGFKIIRVGRPYNYQALKKIRSIDFAAQNNPHLAPVKVIHAHATNGYAYVPMRRFLFRNRHLLCVHVHSTTLGTIVHDDNFCEFGADEWIEWGDHECGEFSGETYGWSWYSPYSPCIGGIVKDLDPEIIVTENSTFSTNGYYEYGSYNDVYITFKVRFGNNQASSNRSINFNHLS